MPKKRNPEQMIQRILDASLELFHTKGYEETTILDIVNEMDVSRGAFYHHFKTKGEVLIKIIERKEFATLENYKKEILDDASLTGIEKLRKIFVKSMEVSFVGEHSHLEVAWMTLLKEPKILSEHIKEIRNIAWFVPIVEEGMRDGSVRENDPQVLLELLFLLLNLWLYPTIYPGDCNYAETKIAMLKEIFDGLGCPLIDEELLAILKRVIQQIPN